MTDLETGSAGGPRAYGSTDTGAAEEATPPTTRGGGGGASSDHAPSYRRQRRLGTRRFQAVLAVTTFALFVAMVALGVAVRRGGSDLANLTSWTKHPVHNAERAVKKGAKHAKKGSKKTAKKAKKKSKHAALFTVPTVPTSSDTGSPNDATSMPQQQFVEDPIEHQHKTSLSIASSTASRPAGGGMTAAQQHGTVGTGAADTQWEQGGAGTGYQQGAMPWGQQQQPGAAGATGQGWPLRQQQGGWGWQTGGTGSQGPSPLQQMMPPIAWYYAGPWMGGGQNGYGAGQAGAAGMTSGGQQWGPGPGAAGHMDIPQAHSPMTSDSSVTASVHSHDASGPAKPTGSRWDDMQAHGKAVEAHAGEAAHDVAHAAKAAVHPHKHHHDTASSSAVTAPSEPQDASAAAAAARVRAQQEHNVGAAGGAAEQAGGQEGAATAEHGSGAAEQQSPEAPVEPDVITAAAAHDHNY